MALPSRAELHNGRARPDDGGSILTVPLNGQEKQDIQFAELPKYDSEGYEYIYVVREYLTGEHAGGLHPGIRRGGGKTAA